MLIMIMKVSIHMNYNQIMSKLEIKINGPRPPVDPTPNYPPLPDLEESIRKALLMLVTNGIAYLFDHW
eukprot:scaffold171823_cov37-Prasinocladus_malaysianus.AAC.1